MSNTSKRNSTSYKNTTKPTVDITKYFTNNKEPWEFLIQFRDSSSVLVSHSILFLQRTTHKRESFPQEISSWFKHWWCNFWILCSFWETCTDRLIKLLLMSRNYKLPYNYQSKLSKVHKVSNISKERSSSIMSHSGISIKVIKLWKICRSKSRKIRLLLSWEKVDLEKLQSWIWYLDFMILLKAQFKSTPSTSKTLNLILENRYPLFLNHHTCSMGQFCKT